MSTTGPDLASAPCHVTLHLATCRFGRLRSKTVDRRRPGGDVPARAANWSCEAVSQRRRLQPRAVLNRPASTA